MMKKIYILIIFLSILVSMSAWFGFFIKIGTIFFFLDLIVIAFISNNRILFNRISRNKSLFILIIIAYIIGTRSIEEFRWFFTTFPALTLLFATNKLLSEVLESTSKWLAFILVPSIIIHILCLMHPLSPVGPSIYSEQYGHFNNYILYIKSTEILGYFFRFSSIFIEPGHLGMILSYYLFALKYNYRSIIVWIFTIALLLTLSLAGYVLFIGGIILYSMSINIKTTIKYIFYGAISIIILIYSLTLVLDDYYIDYINSVTIERLEYDEEKGIKGNNRNNEYADAIFNKFVKTSNVLWGLGSDNLTKEVKKNDLVSAGYKTYILHFGVISLILIGFVYYKIGKKNKATFCFFILICMSFLQRAYPFWAAWLVPYVCFCLNTDQQTIPINVYIKSKKLRK